MLPRPQPMSGWLEKKSGGKDGASSRFDKWDRRFFFLPQGSPTLAYYKSEADVRGSKPPAGTIDCNGASVFLKEVKGSTFRFTIRTPQRELKLRAASATDYEAWMTALGKVAKVGTEPTADEMDSRRTEVNASMSSMASFPVGGPTARRPAPSASASACQTQARTPLEPNVFVAATSRAGA